MIASRFRRAPLPRRLADHRDAHGAGDDDHVAGDRPLLQHEAAHVLARIVEQLRGTHGARDDDRVIREIGSRKLGAITRKLAQQPVRKIVEIVHPLAKIRIGQPDHPRLGLALHPLHRRFRRQAVADRLLELSHQPRSWANMR